MFIRGDTSTSSIRFSFTKHDLKAAEKVGLSVQRITFNSGSDP